MKLKSNPHIGSDFDPFLREEGIYEEVEATALKKVIAAALERQMKRRRISVSKLASELGTSRAAIDRILDRENTSITLNTISRTASALGCRVKLAIVAARSGF
jgi:antitoxin HicB